jgi:hypothetical protein
MNKHTAVTAAKAGVHDHRRCAWIPAFAGTTEENGGQVHPSVFSLEPELGGA